MSQYPREPFEDSWQASPRRPEPSRARPGPGIDLGPVRLTPTLTVLIIALVGSLAYIAFALTVRDASQIPMLASGAAILGIVFVGLAVSGAIKTYEAGMDGRGGRAFGLAIGGGIAAIIGFLCFAVAIVAALVYQQ
jgi:hypothetical protein